MDEQLFSGVGTNNLQSRGYQAEEEQRNSPIGSERRSIEQRLSNLRRYRSREGKTIFALLSSITLVLVLLSLVINSIRENGQSLVNTGKHDPPPTVGATTIPGLVVPSQFTTPTTAPTKKGSLTPTSSPTPGASPTTTSTPVPNPATIYYGVHVATDSLSAVTAFEADAHKAVSIIMFYQQWGLTNGWQYFQPGWMNTIRSHGAIPLLTWDPENPNPGGPDQPAYSLQNIINGNFDAYITRWAQNSKAWGHPFFLRFAHEMNGYWNAWSEQANGNKPGQFVLAWRHIHDIFTRVGATNVSWVWSPNIDYSTSTPLQELYPGDAYVDWVGMDGYNWGPIGGHVWQSFSSLFTQTYDNILSITSRPMMIAETASTEEGGDKASWITDAFVTQLPHNFPDIHAFVWFDITKETDWRIESSSSAQSAFASAIQSYVYASNNFANLDATPIPPL